MLKWTGLVVARSAAAFQRAHRLAGKRMAAGVLPHHVTCGMNRLIPTKEVRDVGADRQVTE